MYPTRRAATEEAEIGGRPRFALPKWIARDEQEYLHIAVEWASDLPRPSAIRRGLRQRMAGSILCDAAGFSRRLEGAYRGMWRRACGGY